MSEYKYYLHYVEECIPKVFECNIVEELVEFVNAFIKKNGSLDDGGDNWIEVTEIYYGKPVKIETMIVVKE